MKHAFAEERRAEADAVQPTDQMVAVPHLDAVAVAALEQRDIEVADAPVDPSVVAPGLRFGAS